MKATDILMDEHRVIERVIAAVDAAVDRLARGDAVRPGFFGDAADFFAGFADGCHHRKEEGALFGLIVECAGPSGGGVTDVMLHEHEEGRALTRALRDAATQLERGDQTARRRVVQAARAYAALLHDHIAREDEMLFPMAAELIPEERHEELLERFARVEREATASGSHERFLVLAERLEREATLAVDAAAAGG